MKRKNRKVRKLLVGVLVVSNILGGMPVYASEQNVWELDDAENREVILEEMEDFDECEEVSDSQEMETELEAGIVLDENDEQTELDEKDILDSPELELEKEAELETEVSDTDINDEEESIELLPSDEEKDELEEADEEISQVDESLVENVNATEIFEENAPVLLASGDYECDVTTYGANGSDSLADHVAIQNALNEAWKQNLADGQQVVVKIPKGTYYLEECLSIYSNTRLELDSQAQLIRRDLSKQMLYSSHRGQNGLCFGESCTHKGYTQSNNIVVSGGIWNGNVTKDTSNGNAGMISFLHAENIRIENTVLKNCCGEHMLVLDGVRNSVVNNVKFENALLSTGAEEAYYGEIGKKSSYTTEEEAIIAAHKEAVHIDVTNKVGTSASFPMDNTVCSNITVQNCNFENVLAGVGAHHTDLPKGYVHSNIKIFNNVFRNLKGNTINAYRMTGMSAGGNQADNVYNFLDIREADASLDTNTAKEIKCAAVYAMGSSSVKLSGEKYDISSKSMHNNYAVDITGSSSCDMTGCTVSNGKMGGVGARNSSDIKVSNSNIVAPVGIAGIYVNNSKASIVNNTITGLKTIDGGIFIEKLGGQKITIEKNNISKFSVGIVLLESQGTISLSQNTVAETDSHGIWVRNSRAIVSGNKVSQVGSKSSGIRIIQEASSAPSGKFPITASMDVSGNTVNGGYFGISTNNEKNVVITGNTVTGCSYTGLEVNRSENVTVKNNKVTNTAIINNKNRFDIAFWNCNSGLCEGNTVTEDLAKNIQGPNVIIRNNKVVSGINGWQQTGKYWYYYKDGNRLTGWQQIVYKGAKCWFYLDSQYGNMLTGWQAIGGKWYYLDPSEGGKMIIGWKKIDKSWYYFQDSGAMKTGWQYVGGNWYYLDPVKGSGKMLTGWKEIKGKWYYLDASAGGAMSTGWKKIGKSWYYLDASAGGAMATGWKNVGGSWYYMQKSGKMQTGWLQLGKQWYYLEADGKMCTGKKAVNGKIYEFSSSGVWVR